MTRPPLRIRGSIAKLKPVTAVPGVRDVAIPAFGTAVVATLGGVCFCYAAWGLVDRIRTYSIEQSWPLTAHYLEFLGKLFVAIGVISGIGFIFAVLFIALGSPWIL